MVDCSDHSRLSSTPSELNKSCHDLRPESRSKSLCDVDKPSQRSSFIGDSYDDITMEVPRSHGEAGGSVKESMDIAGMETLKLDSLQRVKQQQPMTSSDTSSLDYVNRDPNKLQDFVKVDFMDIVAEPEGSHSFNTVWGSSYKVFSLTRFWFYRILSLLCGIPCALLWGLHFACLTFCSVWIFTPCMKSIAIKMKFVGNLWSLCIQSFFDPIFQSVGLLLSRTQVALTLRRD